MGLGAAPPVAVVVRVAAQLNDTNPSGFPEQAPGGPLHRPVPRPYTGVCFSGGGTRALVSCQAQLRALIELGVLESIDYLGGVSGAAWCLGPFAFSPALGDDELLEPLGKPEALTLDNVHAKLAETRVAASAVVSLETFLLAELRAGTPPNRVWLEAVGKGFLQPYGIHSDGPSSFSYDAATAADVVSRNPALADLKMFTVREDRHIPFPVFGATLDGPLSLGPFAGTNPVGVELTPLSCGIPNRNTVAYEPLGIGTKPVITAVGGCIIEPIGLGSTTSIISKPEQVVATPERFVSLSDAIGISSAAFSGLADNLPLIKVFSPVFPYTCLIPGLPVEVEEEEVDGGFVLLGRPTQLVRVPGGPPAKSHVGVEPSCRRRAPQQAAAPAPTPASASSATSTACGAAAEAQEQLFSDGGICDNYGLFPLLRRKVETIVVFCNAEDGVQATGFDPSTYGFVDSYLPPLFGYNLVQGEGINTDYNKVFKAEDFKPLVDQLQASKASGLVTTARLKVEVQGNVRYGIEGGWPLDLALVVLDRVPAWEAKLQDDVRAALFTRDLGGPNFPNYSTIDGKGALIPTLTELTPAKVHLLSDLVSWSLVNATADPQFFQNIFKPPPPPAS